MHTAHNLASRIPLFNGVKDNTLKHLNGAAKMQHYKKGTLLFSDSDSNISLFYLISGLVKLSKEAANGLEFILDILSSRDYFGEDGLNKEVKYTNGGYSAQALSDGSLITFPLSVLQDLLLQDTQLLMNLLNNSIFLQAKRLVELEHLSTQSALQRVGYFLLSLCPNQHKENIVLQLPYDKSIIATRLAMRPETFSRTLAKLYNLANIRIENDSLYIPSVEVLIKEICLNHPPISSS